jgi:hypothetical protein
MDLGAYANIDILEQVLKDNNIEIPRLRGLRLMQNEKIISKDKMDEMVDSIAYSNISSILGREYWGGAYVISLNKQEAFSDYYLIKGPGFCNYIGVRWNRVHGRLRKAMKFEFKKARKRVYEQYEIFNKYAGREDVLYIHARLGRSSWTENRDHKIGEMRQQSWFLEMVHDSFDSTYVDIYAKIQPVDFEELKKKYEDEIILKVILN